MKMAEIVAVNNIAVNHKVNNDWCRFCITDLIVADLKSNYTKSQLNHPFMCQLVNRLWGKGLRATEKCTVYDWLECPFREKKEVKNAKP